MHGLCLVCCSQVILKIAVRRGNPPEVISILDKALSTISDSEKNAIFRRWTHFEKKASPDWGFLAKASSVFLIVLAFLAWHNVKLKKLVNQKTGELASLANTDWLTGANNRRKLEFDFLSEEKRAKMYRQKAVKSEPPHDA